MSLFNKFMYGSIAILTFSLIVFLLFIKFNLKNVETPYQVIIADESKTKLYSVNLSKYPIITSTGQENFIKESIALFFNNNTKTFINSLKSENRQWKDLSVYILPESREYFKGNLINFYEDYNKAGAELIKGVIGNELYLTGIAKTVAGEKLYRYSFKLHILSIGLGKRSNDTYKGEIVIKETNQYNYKGLAIESINVI